jgi:hypothetical protein
MVPLVWLAGMFPPLGAKTFNAGLAMFPPPWSFRLRSARYLFIP